MEEEAAKEDVLNLDMEEDDDDDGSEGQAGVICGSVDIDEVD